MAEVYMSDLKKSFYEDELNGIKDKLKSKDKMEVEKAKRLLKAIEDGQSVAVGEYYNYFGDIKIV